MSIDLHTLSGAYAIDALSSEEAEEFDRHLEQCPACRDEVRELREAAAAMGAGEAAPAPRALRARVLAAADQIPQLPPEVTPIQAARSRRRLTRVVGAAAAVVLLAAVAFGVHQAQSPDRNTASSRVAQVFHAADAKTATLRTPRGTLLVATSQNMDRMAVDTHRLDALPSRKVYQLWTWTTQSEKPVSAGILTRGADGRVMALPRNGTTVAITVEPAGGSKAPTTKPIVQLEPDGV
jgi:anti-sigma-K factor RskA